MIKLTRQYQSAFATLLLGVYLFAVLFSGFFHTHKTHFSAEKISLKTSPISNKLVNFGTSEDCFSCHFSHDNIAVLPTEIAFEFKDFQFSHLISDLFFVSYQQERLFSFSLRAPPIV